MKKLNIVLLLFVMLIFAENTLAQFTITGQLRTRAEMSNGYKTLPTEITNPSYFVGQRTRLNLMFSQEKFNFKVSFQDVRVWGDGPIANATGMWGEHASLDLYEGWAEWLMTDKLSLKVGRQELSYDDGRLLSNRNWNNRGLTYDAAVLKYNNQESGLQLDFCASLNNDEENIFETDYQSYRMKSMEYLYVKKKLNEKMHFSILGLAVGYQKTASPSVIYVKGTMGGNFVYKSDRLFVQGTGFYQMGKDKSGVDVSAYFVGTVANYKIGKINVGLGIDYLSGQDSYETEKMQSFDLHYGARNKFYGNLNYFVTTESTKNGGLTDMYLKVKYQINQKNIVMADFHNFVTAQDVGNWTIDTVENLDKSLGQEIDLMYVYKINPNANMKVGYCFYLPTESLEIIKGVASGKSEFANWAWVMLTFTPELFSNK